MLTSNKKIDLKSVDKNIAVFPAKTTHEKMPTTFVALFC